MSIYLNDDDNQAVPGTDEVTANEAEKDGVADGEVATEDVAAAKTEETEESEATDEPAAE